MLIQEKKYKEYLSQEYEPVDESLMPQIVDFRAIKAYADSKGIAITSLSDEEKQQFIIPNPNYRKLEYAAQFKSPTVDGKHLLSKLNALPDTPESFLKLDGILGRQRKSFSWDELREDAS